MLATKTREYTVAEYAALPEGPPYFQLIDSELVMTPPPLSEHQDFGENLHNELTHFFRTHGVKEYWIADPAEQTIECFQNSDEGFRLVSISRKDDLFTSSLLDGFSVRAGAFFTRE